MLQPEVMVNGLCLPSAAGVRVPLPMLKLIFGDKNQQNVFVNERYIVASEFTVQVQPDM